MIILPKSRFRFYSSCSISKEQVVYTRTKHSDQMQKSDSSTQHSKRRKIAWLASCIDTILFLLFAHFDRVLAMGAFEVAVLAAFAPAACCGFPRSLARFPGFL